MNSTGLKSLLSTIVFKLPSFCSYVSADAIPEGDADRVLSNVVRSQALQSLGLAKYELTDEVLRADWYTTVNRFNPLQTIIHKDVELHRIRALRDIPFHGVKKGDLGGFVEGHGNLSHLGNAWVGGNATVWDQSEVLQNGLVTDSANVVGTTVYGRVSGASQIFGSRPVNLYQQETCHDKVATLVYFAPHASGGGFRSETVLALDEVQPFTCKTDRHTIQNQLRVKGPSLERL